MNRVFVSRMMILVLVLMTAISAGCDDDDDDNNDASPADDDDSTEDPDAFRVTSMDFLDGGDLPVVHVCTDQGGENRSPALAWTNVPNGTQAYAVTCIDLDGPEGPVVHWGLINLPLDFSELPQAVSADALPPDAWHVLSYRGNPRYDGPCPPARHRYEFTVHALNATIAKPGDDIELAAVQSEISAKTIDSAKILGYFPPE